MTDEEVSNREAACVPAASYVGEDTRPTSTKELAGWYMYSFAAETYVLCGALSPVSRRSEDKGSRQEHCLTGGSSVANMSVFVAL